jgi:diguanylate cyclase (GGDEF)-like protein
MRHFAPNVLAMRADGVHDGFASVASETALERGMHLSAAVRARLDRLDASEQCISLIDMQGRLTWMNAAALRTVEKRHMAYEIGGDWLEMWPTSERSKVSAAIASAKAGIPTRFSGVSRTDAAGEADWDVNITPDGPRIAGVPTFTIYMHNVTQRRRAVDRLAWAATHDSLTGLASRSLYHDTLDHMIETSHRTGEAFALVAFDLDRFKQINERLGHAGGDALLRGFAARLAEMVPVGGLAARFGGDEFALLMKVEKSEPETIAFIETMLDCLRLPYEYAGRMIECTASAGIAIYPAAGRSADELFINADIALLSGKAQDPGRAVMFSGEMRQQLQRRASTLEVAAAALHGDWIEPHYQPKIDLATGRLCGLEALLRWRKPDGEWQSPATISAAFDDKCLATKITATMLQKVVLDLKRWQGLGCAVPVAVNASAADFQADDFAERLLEQLEQGGIPPALIELEVTENVFLGDGAAHVSRVLRVLSDAGIRIALDDFGTGYASLSHLKQFPVHVIKIDRSFVSSLTTSHEDRTIVRTMIDLGRSMSIEVVAEGIETAAQLAFLKGTGCNVGQGFLFGKAMPAAQIEAWRWTDPASRETADA